MDRESWSRPSWDVDPRLVEHAVVSSYSMQHLVRSANELQTRLDAAQRLLLKRGASSEGSASSQAA